MVEDAGRFLKAHRAEPFFLYFALNLPHYPYQPEPKWLERYRGLPVPRRLYAAFLSTMDERIGALLRAVDDLGLRRRTIIIFQSDNGHSTEEWAFFGSGSAGPYPGAKFSLFEGGIRLPAIVSWPGHLPEEAVRGQVAHGCDWLPTLVELCRIKLLNPDINGKSLVAVLKAADAPSPHDVLHWQVGTGKDTQWAVRRGHWKLIGNAWDTSVNDRGKERIELFLGNLREDVGEKKNRARERPEVVRRLHTLHDEWVRRSTRAPAR
jgi:arylsulfatase A-like enzyme